MATILVLGVKVPFTSGGAEVLVRSLVNELKKRGHDVDTVELPFATQRKEDLIRQMRLWRELDLSSFAGKKVDLVIGTKFPSYLVRHPRKSIWLVHQHRPVYELFGTRFSDFCDDPLDEVIREEVWRGDTEAFEDSAFIGAISQNVVERLRIFNNTTGVPLYPPLPLGNAYRCEESEPYILSVGRICTIKRVDYLIRALPYLPPHITAKIVGVEDEGGVMEYLHNEMAKHHLTSRVSFLGRVSNEELLSLYARAGAVFYAPYDEDYGYVTLEAFASGKPVVTARDSGGTLEFVHHEETGLVADPTFESIGHAFRRIFDDSSLQQRLGEEGKRRVSTWKVLEGGWDHVVEGLLSPLKGGA